MTKLIKKLDNDKNYEFFFEKKFFLADSLTWLSTYVMFEDFRDNICCAYILPFICSTGRQLKGKAHQAEPSVWKTWERDFKMKTPFPSECLRRVNAKLCVG